MRKTALIEALKYQFSGTPYLVTETEKGADIDINLADANWLSFASVSGLTNSYSYELRINEQKNTFSITDVSRQLQWLTSINGEPVAHYSTNTFRGKIVTFEKQKSYGIDYSNGEFQAVVDYGFHSEPGRDRIREAAQKLGFQEVQAPATKVGFVFAAIGGAIALLAIGTAIALAILFK